MVFVDCNERERRPTKREINWKDGILSLIGFEQLSIKKGKGLQKLMVLLR